MPEEYSEHDKMALLALVTRFSRAQDDLKALTKAKVELDAKIVLQRDQLQKAAGAFEAFGIDVMQKGSKGGFQQVRNIVGSEAYLAALVAAGREYGVTATRDEDFGAPLELEEEQTEAIAENSAGSVRDLTLGLLNEAGEQGTTAAEIRKQIENGRSSRLHYKTVGMTLYRLAQDGLARREGRTWFVVPKTTNPGGETPGPSKSAS